MGSIVLKSLSVLLGIFFLFVGTMKVTSSLSKDLHKDVRKEYVKYAKVFPLASTLGFKIPSKWYRTVVGVLEIISGLAMTVMPNNNVKTACNGVLLSLMMLTIYSQWVVNDKFERIGPALVCFFMLTCRLIIDWQNRDRLSAASGSNGVEASGSRKKQD